MRRTSLLLAVLLAAPLALVPAAAASAATAPPTGVDVSYYQCASDDTSAFPTPATPSDFGVVGVNAGVGWTSNPCLAAQADWATTTSGSTRPALELYVNTQHPDPRDAQWWPSSNRTRITRHAVTNPYGTCHRLHDDAACAYVYGASIAEDDIARIAAAGLVASAQRVWLDVEVGNDWTGGRVRHRAVLEGMATWFAKHGVKTGLYSTHQQWSTIVGSVSTQSVLAGLPSWLSAATTLAGAAENCSHAPLVPRSRVVLAQVVSNDPAVLDTDLVCTKLTADPRPVVHGTARVGHRLTVSTGTWAPSGVTFSYRWLRDGRSISGATGASYVLRRADRHASIGVRVTGVLPGWSRGVRESHTLRVH